MQFAFYFFGSVILFFGSIFTGYKILELIRDYRVKRFKTANAHFLSDLYKLRVKWADLGEAAYVESIDNLIKFYGVIDKVPKLGGVGLPLTNDSMSTDIQLKNQRKEAIIETLNEWIEEF